MRKCKRDKKRNRSKAKIYAQQIAMNDTEKECKRKRINEMNGLN